MESVRRMTKLCLYGFRDCFDGMRKIWNFRYIRREHRANKDVGLSVLLCKLMSIFGLNGVAFGMIIYAYFRFFLPLVQQFTELFSGYFMREWLSPSITFAFDAFWVFPMFLLSRIVNCVLYQDVADVTYMMACGSVQNKQSLSSFISEYCSGLVLQSLFLIQNCLVSIFPIPLVADVISFVHLCLLYSLYAFDYKWVNNGWPLNRRLAMLDTNWPYFVGFGMPLVLMTIMTSSFIARICVFSVFFPFIVVSAMNTTPVTEDFKFRLKAFGPVTFVLNCLTRIGIDYLRKPIKSK